MFSAVRVIRAEVFSFSSEALTVKRQSVCARQSATMCIRHMNLHMGENLIRENSAVRCIRQRYALKGIWF